jgi:hypothetical protein
MPMKLLSRLVVKTVIVSFHPKGHRARSTVLTTALEEDTLSTAVFVASASQCRRSDQSASFVSIENEVPGRSILPRRRSGGSPGCPVTVQKKADRR